MRFVISLIKSVISPVSVLLNLLIGFIAAMLSGVIEYYVLKELFSKIITDGQVKTLNFLPIIIVIILEGSKLFLHFGSSAFNNVSTTLSLSTVDFTKAMNVIKVILVVFSFICTIIFTGNVLYYDNVKNNSENLKTQISAINQQYEVEIEECKQKYTDLNNSKLKSYETAWKNAEEELSEHLANPVLTPKVAYDRYQQKAKELEAKVDEKHTQYIEYSNSVNLDLNSNPNYINEINTLENERDEEISKVKENNVQSNEGDNSYIKTFLLLVFNTFLNKDVYPRWLYFIIVIFISVVIAGVLEAVIYISQRFITTPSTELQNAFDYEGNDFIKDKTKSVVRFIICIAFSFSIYVIYGLISEISLDKFNILSGLVCCIITVVIFSIIPISISQNHYEEKEDSSGKFNKIQNEIKNFLATEGKTMLIKGLLSFVLFIVLGIIYKKDIADITVAAVGVAAGQAIGQILHIDPREIAI